MRGAHGRACCCQSTGAESKERHDRAAAGGRGRLPECQDPNLMDQPELPAALTADAGRKWRPARSRRRSVVALRDLSGGLTRWWLWGLLAWYDIKHRYRGSVIGPFWVTLSTLAMVAALGMIYSGIFHQEIRDYLPYLAVGMITWTLISAVLTEACTIFVSVEQVIKQINMPFSAHVYRVLARNFIIYGHNLIVYVGVVLFFGVPVRPVVLLALAGFALFVLFAVPVALLLAMICARFRDVPQIVASVIQVVFFMTPIFFRPEMLGGRIRFITYNPFYAFIDLIRSPMLGDLPAASSWAMAAATVAVAWLVGFPFFARFRARIAYWV